MHVRKRFSGKGIEELSLGHGIYIPSVLLTAFVWTAITNYHRLGGLNNYYLFLTVLEAGSTRSECQLSQVLVRVLFQAADSQLLASSHAERE
jgi:hypothetical protein